MVASGRPGHHPDLALESGKRGRNAALRRGPRVAGSRFWRKIFDSGTSGSALSLHPQSEGRFTPNTNRAMSAAERYDAIVIGAGQAGGPLASALARSGRRTALIEREHVGGTCINEGCTPTKTMVASARVAYLARRGGDYGVSTGPVTVDMGRVRERKRAIVKSFRAGSLRRIEAAAGARPHLRRGAVHRAEAGRGGRKGARGRPAVHQHRLPAGRPRHRGARPGTVARFHFGDGARSGPGAPPRARRRLHRAGVRADVPPVRQPGHHRPARPPAPAAGGCRRRGGGARDPAGGRARGPAGGRSGRAPKPRATASV